MSVGVESGEMLGFLRQPNLRLHCFIAITAFMMFSCSAEVSASDKPNKGFVAEYEAPETPAYQGLYQAFKDDRILDALAQELNKIVLLPESITLATAECGVVNAFYVAEHRAVIVCYELLVDLAQKFAGVEGFDTIFSGVFTWIFLHELGHALIDVLELPITGKEEDVADEFATMMALDEGDEGVEVVESAAVWFLLNFEQSKVADSVYADTHALNAQRFYNVVCWIYGSNTEKHKDIVAEGWLPPERALSCPREYQRARRAWKHLLGPYLTEEAKAAGP